MAQFDYASYSAAHSRNNNSGDRPRARFLGEFLAKDGDSVIVRFPYASMEDVTFETTHTVDWPGSKYGKRVRCSGNDNCPLCAEGVKVDTRFFVKALVYVTENGKVVAVPAIWDRPAMFADVDLKQMFTDAADFGATLPELLVRIKRAGSGTSTRYTFSLALNNNKAVYNPQAYVADFSVLDSMEPARVLTKTYEQYQAALNPEESAPVAPAPVEPTYVAPNPVPTYPNPVQPAPVQQAPATQSAPAAQPERKRYTF